MQQTKQGTGVTFAVDPVQPATEHLPQRRTHEALHALLGGIESCHDYHGTVIDQVYYQPLLTAVYTAFSQHRPLVLTPDAVWITIAQGVAHHMVIHGERLRSRLVSHQGKLDLIFACHGWVPGSPENPWREAFASWAGQIRQHVGPGLHDTLVCDFSTSGPTERAASQVVMMDVFERYFHYDLYAICGIPTVTLEGTTADWRRLADKAAALAVFDLDWWLGHLRPICEQFIRASRGDVDLEHWQGICKLRSAYGGYIINGWVAKLFPYLRAFIFGPCTRKNPIFETGEGFQTFDAPSGLSQVPFTWRDLIIGRERLMEAVGGLVGVSQDAQTLALRPEVGWAVREAEKMDVLLRRLAADHVTFPRLQPKQARPIPSDLCKFYHHTGGAELFGRGAAALCRIVPADEIQSLEWGEKSAPRDIPISGWDGRVWHRFAFLSDGTWLAMNLDTHTRDPRPRKDSSFHYDPNFRAICHVSAATQNRAGLNPVVALSFTELLERLLAGGEQPYWLAPGFESYGDAELYTRRN
jgi:hypothetical protein